MRLLLLALCSHVNPLQSPEVRACGVPLVEFCHDVIQAAKLHRVSSRPRGLLVSNADTSCLCCCDESRSIIDLPAKTGSSSCGLLHQGRVGSTRGHSIAWQVLVCSKRLGDAPKQNSAGPAAREKRREHHAAPQLRRQNQACTSGRETQAQWNWRVRWRLDSWSTQQSSALVRTRQQRHALLGEVSADREGEHPILDLVPLLLGLVERCCAVAELRRAAQAGAGLLVCQIQGLC